LVGDAQSAPRLREQHDAAIRRDPSAIEGGADLLVRNRWQVKGQGYIVIHRSSPLLDRCALSARGIMPYTQV
jgi:hypothetical protein